MLTRPAEAKDWAALVQLIQEWIDTSTHPMAIDAELEPTLTYILSMAKQGYALVIDETYLVIYEISPIPFTTKHTVITERLIAKLYSGNNGSVLNVFKFLANEKLHTGAKYVLIGDLLHFDQERYGRVLTKLGMERTNSLYLM